MNNYELHNHKQSDFIKWIISFTLIFVLIIGMVASLALGLENRKNENKETPGIEQEETVSGSQILTRPMLLHGVKLYAAENPTTAPEGSVTLNATLNASGTIYNDNVLWEYAFQNPTSAWANGKTLSDYMSIIVSEDTHSATFTCNAPFGEPIIVTAISEDNPECTATCQFDYVKRITSVSDFYINNDSTYGTSYKNYIRMEMTNTVTAFVEYGVGTISPNIDILTMDVALPSEFTSVIAANITSGSMNARTYTNSIITCTPTQGSTVIGSFKMTLTNFYTGGGDTRQLNNILYNNAYNAETGNGAPYCVGKPSIKISVTYGDVIYQTFSYTHSSNVAFEKGALESKTAVTSVALDEENVAF